MEPTALNLEFQMATHPELASQVKDEVYQRYMDSHSSSNPTIVELKEAVLSWEQKTRALPKSAQKLCIQRIRATALEALRDLDFRVTLGSRTNLSEAAARWIKQLNDIGSEYCQPKKRVLPPLDEQIGEVTLQPRIRQHVPRSIGTLFSETLLRAQGAIGMATNTAVVAGEKLLASVSDAIIPSSSTEEPPPYQPPKENPGVRFDDLWSNYEYFGFGRRPDWMNNSCPPRRRVLPASEAPDMKAQIEKEITRLYKTIRVRFRHWTNSCAANMRHVLLASEAPDMKAQKRPTVLFEKETTRLYEKIHVLFRLRDLDIPFRENDIGTPLKIAYPREDLDGRRGILLFQGDFGDDEYYVTLWNGSSYHPEDPCRQIGCYQNFDRAEAVYFYEFKK